MCQEHLTNKQIHECRYKKETAVGFRFTSEMFKVATAEPGVMHITELAQLSQSALDKYLSECPVVYGLNEQETGRNDWHEYVNGGTEVNTHRAVLFNVQPIKTNVNVTKQTITAQMESEVYLNGTHKQPIKLQAGDLLELRPIEQPKCEHKPGFMTTYDASTCVNCGVRLTATWKAEGE